MQKYYILIICAHFRVRGNDIKYIFWGCLTGTKPGSRHCNLQNEDASEKHFMEITSAPLAPSFTSCSPQQPKIPRDDMELHIVNIPENANIW